MPPLHIVQGPSSPPLTGCSCEAQAAGTEELLPHFLSGKPDVASSFLSLRKANLVEMLQAAPPSVLVPLHAASIVVAMPGHLAVELGEGFLFGFSKGLFLALVGKSLGVLTAFGLGRSALGCWDLRSRLNEKIHSWPVAKQLATSVERGGALSVFLIRIAPVPCFVKNYAVPILTDIPMSTYLLATLAGLVPTTAAHVGAGTLATSLTELASGQGAPLRAVALMSALVGGGAIVSAFAGLCVREAGPACCVLQEQEHEKPFQFTEEENNSATAY